MKDSLALFVALLLLSAPWGSQQIPDQSQEDFYILNFPESPEEQLTLIDFVNLVGEATGFAFTYDTRTRERLQSTKLLIPGTLRVPTSAIYEFSRFQLFLRGFGCFEDEPSQGSQVMIRPVPSSLVRVAFPPVDVLFGIDELRHPDPVDSAQPAGDAPQGVVLSRPEATPGHTLVTGLTSAEATLIDLQGQVLRHWTDPEGDRGPWDQALVLRNGDLLCVAPRKKELLRLGFDGSLVWRLSLGVHHEATELADGRILVLTRRIRVIPAIDPKRRSVDNLVTLVSSDGQVLKEHSLYDILHAEPLALPIQRPPRLEDLPPGYDIDPMHASSLCSLENPEVQKKNPLFRPGRVLVAFRNLDSVALVDLAEGRCVWAWGKSELQGPHAASFLEDGSVLVLDAGHDPHAGSRVLAVDPLTGHVAWEYRAPTPSDSPSSGWGTVQALASGNVLVGSSNGWEAFELTRAGEVVWRYLNPRHDTPGGGVQRVRRYSSEFIAPLLAAPVNAPR